MGVFDVRCAVSGLILRTEDVLLVPLVLEHEDSTEGLPIALPIAGELDGYGGVEAPKSATLDAFTKGFLARVTFQPGVKPPKTAKMLIEHLTDSDTRLRLGERHIGIAYVLRAVFDALVTKGSNVETSMRLRGKNTAESLFPEAFVESELASSFYESATGEKAKKELRLALTALVRSGLGRAPLRRVTDEDRQQYSDADIADSIAEAKQRFADDPAMQSAIAAYEAEQEGEPPTIQARFSPDALAAAGFAPADGAYRRTIGDAVVELAIEGSEKGTRIVLRFAFGSGARSERTIELSTRPDEPESRADHFFTSIMSNLESTIEEQRAIAGELTDPARIAALFQESHWFMRDFFASEAVSPAIFPAVVAAMKTMPYGDAVREAWIALLNRPDCPLEVAELLADHPSKSLRDAVAARLARA